MRETRFEASSRGSAEDSLRARLGERQRWRADILADVEALAGHHCYPSAAKRFGEFRLHEERHLQLEQAAVDLVLRHHPEAAEVQRLCAVRPVLLALLVLRRGVFDRKDLRRSAGFG